MDDGTNACLSGLEQRKRRRYQRPGRTGRGGVWGIWRRERRISVKNGAKGTYLTAAVQRCCGGVALFLDGAALFLQRCCDEKALRWHVRFRLFTFADPSVGTCVFSLTYGCIGGTCTFRSFTCKESRTPDPQQIFSVTGARQIPVF